MVGTFLRTGLVVAALLSGSGAFAANNAVSTGGNMTAAPEAGANSYTEGQAKSRIEQAGFTGVSALKKDEHGVWRGTAMKDGASTPVALDYKGNVSAK